MTASRDALCLTLDTDWVPGWMLCQVTDLLCAHGTRATVFVTDDNEGLARLRERSDLFELGMHPNCLPGSTHGDSESTVMHHMRAMLPQAKAMRTHGLYQSTPFLQRCAKEHGVETDCSLLLHMHPCLQPTGLPFGPRGLVRLPICWEDDMAVSFSDTLDADSVCNGPGLRMLNFHPVHILLNSRDMERYNSLRRERPLQEWTSDFVRTARQEGPGVGALFEEIVRRMAGCGATVSELAEAWRTQCGWH